MTADLIRTELERAAGTLAALAADTVALAAVERAAALCVEAIRAGGKLLLAGNGGSAADSQHIAAELVGRLGAERRALPAVALTTDTSILTAVGNDYGHERIFSRQIEALGRAGDVFVAISTSGRSANILQALDVARERGLVCIGLTGAEGGALRSRCDCVIQVPARDTQHIQEGHIAVGHALCLAVERELA